jgi:DNA-binding CsgD family transcriptional regulator
MIGAMARRLTSPVLVGREALIEQLNTAVQAARVGEPRHAVIGGEAGVGKTRLLAAVAELARAEDVRVLSGRCVAIGDAGLPFAPYTEILRLLVVQEGAPAMTALAGRAAADLARLVPALGPDDRIPTPELWTQLRLHEALADLLQRLADRTPLLVQLEDLHWADAGTLSATAYLLRAVAGSRICLMATFRSDDVTRTHPLRPWLAEISRDAAVERIDLAPLTATETATLIGHIVGEELGAARIDEIQRRSDGNPFFIEELLASRAGSSSALPTTLREVLLARVDDLSGSARDVIDVASVGGREVEHEMLGSVLDGGGRTWDGDLRELVDAGLLVPTRALDRDDAYSFRHALLQEAVYESILPSERRRLHRAWGEIVASHHVGAGAAADDLVNLAHHWREARDPRALDATVAAGDAAMAGFSYAAALDQFEEALHLWEDGSETTLGIDHVALLERASRAAYLSAQHRRAVALCRSALDELGDTDAAHRTTLRILLGRTLWVSGDYAASIEAYEAGVRDAPDEPPIIRARALAGLGQVYMLHSRHPEARVLCEEAIAAARAIGARDLEGHGLNTLGVVLAGLGEVTAANEAIADARAIALDLGIPDDIGRAYVNQADIEHFSGYPDRAVETSLEGLRVTHEWGVSSTYGAWIAYGAATFAFEAGIWDRAVAFLEKADRIVGDPETATIYRASYAMELLACLGDPGFEALWERIRRVVAGTPLSDNQVAVLQAGLMHLSFAGRHTEAVAVAREALDLVEGLGTSFRASDVSRVVAWALADAVLAARRGLSPAVPDEDELQARCVRLADTWRARLPDPGLRLSEVLRLDGEQVAVELARIRDADDATRWSAVADGWSDMGRPFRVAIARWRQAQAAERDGDREGATLALREAHRLAIGLGAAPMLVLLESMARRMRVRLTSGTATTATPTTGVGHGAAAYGLTPRELEVLTAVAAGRTNRQIAEALFISESTAGVHVSNILGKLGAGTRTEAARMAVDQNLVPDREDPAPPT